MFPYRAYGLSIKSAIPLPGLLPFSNATQDDLTIKVGNVPDTLDEITGNGILYQVNAQQFRLHVPTVARYLAQNGQQIIIQQETGTDNASVSHFLLHPVMSALLHQRRMLPLRGSCIETPKGAVVFAGIPGAGKSTLAAWFSQRGYRVLSDDITVLSINETGEVVAFSGYPSLHLWLYALEQLNYTEAAYKVRPCLEKYVISLSTEQFCDSSLPVHAIYILKGINRNEFSLDSFSPISSIPVLISMVYQLDFASKMGKIPVHWNTLTTVAQTVHTAEVRRPVQTFDLEALASKIETDWNA